MEFVFFWFLFGVFSGVIASAKGRSGFGWFLLGLLFGPFGLLVAALPSLKQAQPVARTAAPTTTKARESPLETIDRLAKLRDAGALSDDEFEAKKNELLERV